MINHQHSPKASKGERHGEHHSSHDSLPSFVHVSVSSDFAASLQLNLGTPAGMVGQVYAGMVGQVGRRTTFGVRSASIHEHVYRFGVRRLILNSCDFSPKIYIYETSFIPPRAALLTAHWMWTMYMTCNLTIRVQLHPFVREPGEKNSE